VGLHDTLTFIRYGFYQRHGHGGLMRAVSDSPPRGRRHTVRPRDRTAQSR
jgi:hypothetical protein